MEGGRQARALLQSRLHPLRQQIFYSTLNPVLVKQNHKLFHRFSDLVFACQHMWRLADIIIIIFSE